MGSTVAHFQYFLKKVPKIELWTNVYLRNYKHLKQWSPKCCDLALIKICVQCRFCSDGVSADVTLLCYTATLFRETIKGTLQYVYQWNVMKSFVHVKNMPCGQEYVSINEDGKI